MQGHQKIVLSIVLLILHWLLEWSKCIVQNSCDVNNTNRYYSITQSVLILYPFRRKQLHGEDFFRTRKGGNDER